MSRKAKNENFDPQVAASNTYNDIAGGQKNIDIGPKLLPIKLSETSWTTDGSTARQVQKGTSIALFNNGTVAYTITFGQDNTVTAGAAGAVDANGNVSIPCKPGTWSYVAAGNDTWLITNNALLLVFIIDDHTKL